MGSRNHGRRFVIDEGSDASLPYRGEVWRKGLHLLSLSIPVGLLFLGRSTALYILIPLAAVFVAAELLRNRSEKIRGLIKRAFGFMMRPTEIPPVGSPLKFNGATWVLLSACVVVALFEPRVAAASLVIGLIGDAAAALIGRRLGRHPIGKRGKSIEGSIAFAAASLVAVSVVPGIPLKAAAAAVAVATVVEGVGSPINDNLLVPLTAGIILSLF